MAIARANAFFALADANKDGKLTKDEVANFIWGRLSKADANHDNAVTKEELAAHRKALFAERRAHREGLHAEKRAAKGAARAAAKAAKKNKRAPSQKAPVPAKPEKKKSDKTAARPARATQTVNKVTLKTAVQPASGAPSHSELASEPPPPAMPESRGALQNTKKLKTGTSAA